MYLLQQFSCSTIDSSIIVDASIKTISVDVTTAACRVSKAVFRARELTSWTILVGYTARCAVSILVTFSVGTIFTACFTEVAVQCLTRACITFSRIPIAFT